MCGFSGSLQYNDHTDVTHFFENSKIQISKFKILPVHGAAKSTVASQCGSQQKKRADWPRSHSASQESVRRQGWHLSISHQPGTSIHTSPAKYLRERIRALHHAHMCLARAAFAISAAGYRCNKKTRPLEKSKRQRTKFQHTYEYISYIHTYSAVEL